MKKLLFLLTISTFLFSCRVTWVPAKSPSMIVDLLDVQSSTDNLYDAIIASPDKSYTRFEASYTAIETKIDSIVAVNEKRDHAKNIYSQTLLLERYFNKYQALHKTRASIPNEEFRVYKEYLKSFIKPILVSELSLK